MDELVARMVEIGFDVEESKFALSQSGNNLQAAAEFLLKQRSSGSSSRAATTASSNSTDAIMGKLAKLGMSSKNAEKAGKLINAAGDMGMSFFQRAKVLVADTTKKVSTAIDDRRRPNGGRQGSRESMGSNEEEERRREGSFQLRGNDQGWDSPHGSEENVTSFDNGNNQQQQKPSSTSFTANFDNKAAFQTAAALARAAVPAPPPFRPKKRRTTPLVQATPDAMAACDRIKEQGNHVFRQGQYGDAEEFYSKSIACLPEGHLSLIPLLNNRAAARLKTGNYKECVVDCSLVESMSTRELEYDGDLDDGTVTVEQVQEYKDSISKALLRRATAYENMEKWEEAGRDYKRALDWNPGAKGAHDGIRRCGKATTRGQSMEAEDKVRGNHSGETNHGGSLLGGVDATDGFGAFDPFGASARTAKGTSAVNDLSFLAAPVGSQPKPAAAAATPFTTATVVPPVKATPPAITTITNDNFKSERVEALREKDQQKLKEDEEKLAAKDSVDAMVCWIVVLYRSFIPSTHSPCHLLHSFTHTIHSFIQ